MSNSHTEWTARAVQEALADAKKPRTSLSDETGIPYSTLNRKISGHSEFSFTELLHIADALSVHPSIFVPPAFVRASSTSHAA